MFAFLILAIDFRKSFVTPTVFYCTFMSYSIGFPKIDNHVIAPKSLGFIVSAMTLSSLCMTHHYFANVISVWLIFLFLQVASLSP